MRRHTNGTTDVGWRRVFNCSIFPATCAHTFGVDTHSIEESTHCTQTHAHKLPAHISTDTTNPLKETHNVPGQATAVRRCLVPGRSGGAALTPGLPQRRRVDGSSLPPAAWRCV